MKPTSLISALFIVVFAISTSFAQKKQTLADSLYNEGVTFYSQNQLTEAVTKFEETISQNPKHKDALFNLAVISLGAGDREKGVSYLQTCVRLGDREAASMLRDKLNVQIAYADTMYFEDIEVGPKIIVKGVAEDLFIPGDINPALRHEILKGMKGSKLISKDAGKSRLYALNLFIRENGTIDAEVLNHDSKMVQREVSRILQSIPNIIAPSHNGKNVTLKGFVIPIRVTNLK
ncbi:hypothetical protein H7F15_07775 [Pontibacter sp. Tf4]|uniref:tetratricopeptide repeat protein n=1 Tax=Pontibacter sp. Tf4 TaxID=2761620 RepID=UPI0016277C0D|nr:tetratricopeptide repeat protein [Pontibacter sp. Tf4]MBB6610930.1 hypothetical protein [Pontibacter sp. Tf4]